MITRNQGRPLKTNQITTNKNQQLPTPIKIGPLTHWLEGYKEKNYIIKGFTHGFSLNISGQPNHLSNHNHPSALLIADLVQEKIDKEVTNGRTAGPFQSPPFFQFTTSPLGAVPKKEPGEFRIIHDLSYPKNNSVNSCISKLDSAVSYETLDHFITLLKEVGRGALIAKADIENAFRNIPVHPSSYQLLGMYWKGKFYYDKVLPFGLATSCKIFEAFSTAIQWVLMNKLKVKYVTHILDDFMFIGPPCGNTCDQYLSKFMILAQDIGIPVKHAKTVYPTTDAIVHGIRVNTIEMSMSLPDDKCETIKNTIISLYKRKKCTVREIQSLVGHLNFACLVVLPGRPFLRRLIDLTRGATNKNHFIRINQEARADMAAWLHFISSFNGKCLLLPERWSSSDSIKLYTDSATTCGIAAVFGKKWFNGAWPDSWEKYHISILELFPIVAALEVWGSLLSNHCVLFLSDNMAVVDVINKQTARDRDLMVLVRRLTICAMQFNILLKAKHIPGKYNVVADKLSRFQVSEAKKWAPWLSENPTVLPKSSLPESLIK